MDLLFAKSVDRPISADFLFFMDSYHTFFEVNNYFTYSVLFDSNRHLC